jgi:hypothetical protein
VNTTEHKIRVKGKTYLGYDHYLQGFASTHPLTTEVTNVTAVSKCTQPFFLYAEFFLGMMMVSARLFEEVGKFDENLHTDMFVDVSLCLKVKEKGLDSTILPFSLAQNNLKMGWVDPYRGTSPFPIYSLSSFSFEFRTNSL